METPEDGHRFAQHAYLRGHLVLIRPSSLGHPWIPPSPTRSPERLCSMIGALAPAYNAPSCLPLLRFSMVRMGGADRAEKMIVQLTLTAIVLGVPSFVFGSARV